MTKVALKTDEQLFTQPEPNDGAVVHEDGSVTRPLTLDERIAQLLANSDDQPSALFALYLFQIDGAIAIAEREGREALKRSVDPAILDPTARGVAHDCEHAVIRYKTARERLKVLHATAVRKETITAFNDRSKPVRDKVHAQELATVFPEAVKTLVDLFRRCAAADQEAKQLDYNRPPGAIPLRSVEESIGKGEKIIEKVRLSALSAKGVEELWPPKSTWQTEYYESIAAGLQTLPPTDAERAAATERQMKFVQEQERERQQKNAEAVARAAAHESEQKRLVAGQVR
jgi:hypothetical protein